MPKVKGVQKRQRKRRLQIQNKVIPLLILATIGWATALLVVFQASPDNPLLIVSFFTLLFFNLLTTFSIFIKNRRRVYLVTVSLFIFLVMRTFGMGNFLNGMLLAGIAVTVDVYFNQSSKK